MVHHQFECASGTRVAAYLLNGTVRAWRMMHHTKRIHKIIGFDRDGAGELLGVGHVEIDAVTATVHLCAPTRHLDRFFREINSRYPRAIPCKVDGIGADSTTDFENPLPLPTREVRKPKDMRLYKILPSLHLIEVFAGSYGAWRVPDVAGALVPVVRDGLDRHAFKHRRSHPGIARAAERLRGPPQYTRTRAA